jgi:hypothetical protein
VRGPLEALSLLLLIVGGFVLSHSSVIEVLKGEEGAAGDLLTPRLRAQRMAAGQSGPLPPPLAS